MTLQETIAAIGPLDKKAEELCMEHWDALAKPLRSLGKFETCLAQIAGIQRNPKIDIEKKGLIVMCADNGVVVEGVTQTGQEVTAQVAENFAEEKKATTTILCRKAGADIFPIDIGVYRDTKIRNCKIAYGTKNLYKEPAMTREEAIRALETGINLAAEKKEEGYKLLAVGEMGIGNTTTSSAVASVLMHRPVEEMTGRGAGLSSSGLARKIEVIQHAIELHQPDPEDAIDVLAKVGGLDIAGMAGVFLGGAACRIPVVIDGFIAGVAALVAQRICPACGDYMIASHISQEPATKQVLAELGKEAFINADMHLGEGSGAVMLFPFLDMAAEVYFNMATFQENDIENYVPLD
ncbi:MAG: nicotinate-nucleotide--dimethylbenzimidazole phosphoribosyltransferase [Lachnospiraceae bacterium]|nr:nicotinate-nucleotide--dimethylbenzimidazole phosphoribosyltransferase [Lachnospiraceae bacterium]